MANHHWPVACPLVDRFEECREVERRDGLVTIRANGQLWNVPEFEYDRRAALHAKKHAEQRAKFQSAAPAPFLGRSVFWFVYIKGYFKHGAFRNPLEAEARAAENRASRDGSTSGGDPDPETSAG